MLFDQRQISTSFAILSTDRPPEQSDLNTPQFLFICMIILIYINIEYYKYDKEVFTPCHPTMNFLLIV